MIRWFSLQPDAVERLWTDYAGSYDAFYNSAINSIMNAKSTSQTSSIKRNVDSMKGRFKRLNENANKWVGAYKEASSRRKSKMNNKDVEKEADAIYESGGTKFQDSIMFNEVMCKHPKWALTYNPKIRSHAQNQEIDEEKSRGSSKRSKTSKDGKHTMPSNAETPSTGCSNNSRPIGRDKAKRKRKGKISQSDFAHEFIAEPRAMRLSRENDAETMKSVATAKIEIEREKMYHKTLNILLAKPHLSPEEEEMKRKLMAMLYASI